MATMSLPGYDVVQTVFENITRSFGISFVPDLFQGMRTRSAYLEAAWDFFNHDMNLARLDRRTKVTIALAITTNDAGTYLIAALPEAFGQNVLDQMTWNQIVSFVQFLSTFDRYLSGIMPVHFESFQFVNNCLREEYRNYIASSVTQIPQSREGKEAFAFWIVQTLLVCGFLSVGLYLIFG
jgi:hypothetical protein